MKVAVGAVMGALGGPAVYARELLRAMVELNSEIELVVLTDRPEEFSSFVTAEYLPLASSWEQPLWDHIRVPRALARIGADLYHGTKGVVPLASACPSIVTIHDLAAYVLPETFHWAQRLHQKVETPLSVRWARSVVTVSEASARDLRRYFPKAAGKIEVIGNGLTLRGPSPDAEGSDAQVVADSEGALRFGYLGTIQPRKNVDRLVAAFLKVAGPDWRLEIAGRIRPGFQPAFLDCDDPRVRYLGVIDDAQVPVFLGSLDAMISPSSYEGFGLTLVEAMAAGTPVVAVACSAVPEVVGEAAILLEAPEEAQIGAALSRLAQDPELRSQLSERGRERAALHTWSRAAQSMLSLYERVASGPSS